MSLMREVFGFVFLFTVFLFGFLSFTVISNDLHLIARQFLERNVFVLYGTRKIGRNYLTEECGSKYCSAPLFAWFFFLEVSTLLNFAFYQFCLCQQTFFMPMKWVAVKHKTWTKIKIEEITLWNIQIYTNVHTNAHWEDGRIQWFQAEIFFVFCCFHFGCLPSELVQIRCLVFCVLEQLTSLFPSVSHIFV